jgi:5,10-methylenetetrahydromethanopterin reductase
MIEPGIAPRISVRLPPCRPFTDMVDVVISAERYGFEAVSMPDSPLLWRDPYTALALAATRTDTIGLTVGVSNFVSRHPAVIASAGRGLAEIAPGRIRVGIGAGDSAVRLTGESRLTTAQLREGIETLRSVTSGQIVGEGEQRWQLHDPAPFPILMAAEGPRNTALAAELADGVITSQSRSESKHAAIIEAADRVGRKPPRHIAMVFTCVTEDIEQAAQVVKPFVLREALSYGTERFERAGFPIAVPAQTLRLPDGTDISHSRDTGAAIELASKYVTDDLAVWYAQTTGVFGSGVEVAARLRDLATQGVDEVILHNGQSFELPLVLMQRVAEEVMPELALDANRTTVN